MAHDIACTLERAGYAVAGQAATAAEAVAAVERSQPDLVLLDIHLGEPDEGLRLADALAAPILFVSGRSDVGTLRHAGATRAQGFVVKPFSPAQLLASVEIALGAGEHQRSEAAARDALARIARTLQEAGFSLDAPALPRTSIRRVAGLDALSPREREILKALLEHRRPRQIAQELFISVHTVRNHLKSIYAKLDVHSHAELVELLIVREDEGD